MSLEGRSRPTHRSNLTDWDKYQAANLVAPSSSTLSFITAIVLQVEESWTNLSTMRASQAKWQFPPLSSPDPKFPNQPPSPKSPPLLRESQPNLLTMQARRPRRGVDGRRWRKCPLNRAPLDHICTMVSMIVEAPKMQKKWNVAEGSKRNNKRNCSHLIFV